LWGYHLLGLSRELLPEPSDLVKGFPLPPRARERSRVERLRDRGWEWADVLTRARLSGWSYRQQTRIEAVAAYAVQNYEPSTYEGRVTLIRSEEYVDNPLLGRWYEATNGAVDEHVVRGSHRSILREPDVAGLAACLEECIADATEHRPAVLARSR
jgi:thioesterase domain-containing protein